MVVSCRIPELLIVISLQFVYLTFLNLHTPIQLKNRLLSETEKNLGVKLEAAAPPQVTLQKNFAQDIVDAKDWHALKKQLN